MRTSYQQKILKNFEKVDALLAKYNSQSSIYKLLFILRTNYCVLDELDKHAKRHTFKNLAKKIIVFCIWVLRYPFIGFVTNKKQSIMILNGARFDELRSKKLSIPILRITRHWQLPTIKAIYEEWNIIGILIRLLINKNISSSKIIRLSGCILRAWKIYNTVDLSSIKLIIAEDDILADNVAILMLAKELGIKRIKIEDVQIDSIMHNNVYCDYYFYPSTYHRQIREKSPWNKNLIYIEGGYLNVDYLKYAQIISDAEQQNLIVFYTSHGNIFVHDDCFYIDEILRLLPSENTLCIKIHPLDYANRYNKYKSNSQIKIYIFSDIDNSTLITKSKISFSQFSAMSFEAKHNCEQSYFLNYAWKDSILEEDYNYINNFFDTIDTPQKLSQVLCGEYKPRPIEEFRKNVNMKYPNTFEVFSDFVNTLIGNTKN